MLYANVVNPLLVDVSSAAMNALQDMLGINMAC